MCTQNEAMLIFREAVQACGKVLDGRFKDAWLYGSCARGDFREESDIDILLTVDMTDEELKEHRRELSVVNSDPSMEHDVTVSVTAKPLDRFIRYADTLPYDRYVLREGIAYGAPKTERPVPHPI